jgi:hypothetical protein
MARQTEHSYALTATHLTAGGAGFPESPRKRGTKMTQSFSGTMRVLAVAAAALSLATSAWAQPTQAKQSVPGAPKVTTTQLKGEVAYLQGDYLIAKMTPSGNYRLFQLRPGKTATIDGVVMPLNKAPIGTVLTADVTVTETPVVDRTITTLKGKVWVAAPTSVILTLENGENKQYDIPAGFKFDVDGKKLEAMELRQGMNLTATKIVESPRTEVTMDNVVTGVGPKKHVP